jgi:hypothetical protein
MLRDSAHNLCSLARSKGRLPYHLMPLDFAWRPERELR